MLTIFLKYIQNPTSVPHLHCYLHSPMHHHLLPRLKNSFLAILHVFTLALLWNILQTTAAEREFWVVDWCHLVALLSLVSWLSAEYPKYTHLLKVFALDFLSAWNAIFLNSWVVLYFLQISAHISPYQHCLFKNFLYKISHPLQ